MADTDPKNFQIPPEMRSLAEQSVQQARNAFEGFFSATQRAMSAFEGQTATAQANAKTVTAQAIGFAERNITASLEYAGKLARAKDTEEVIRVHSDYVKSQMQTLADQAKQLGEGTAKAASDTAASAASAARKTT